MKNLFIGGKAVITIPIAFFVAVAVLPFAIGGGLGYLAFLNFMTRG